VKQSKNILIWVGVILALVFIYQFVAAGSTHSDKVEYSKFVDSIRSDEVKSVEAQGMEIKGEYRNKADGKPKFETYGVIDADMRDLLEEHKVTYTFKPEENGGWWQTLLISWLPMIFVVGLMLLIMRQLQSGGGKAMSFGKSKARLLNESQNKITFDDVAGIDEAKAELQEIVEFLKDPKKFTRLGGRIPKGVLLMGSPGTGKTLLARGVAGEAEVPFFSISGSDFVEMFVGVGASRVRDLFEQGKKHAPCIIFIDEIDAVGRYRGAGLGGGHDEREQTLNQLLVEMDGFESNEGVILIAATNRPDVLDPALLRPGRFDRRVVVPPPDVKGREGILRVHMRRTPVSERVDVFTIARGTPGFSGADLENLVNEAALNAARRGADKLEPEDFEDAKDKVLMGAERKSMIISERDRRTTAYHEAGHALVARLLPQGQVDPVHKITIIPRGRALGLVQQLPDEDRLNVTREWALNRIAIAMGGRVAEEVIFNQITTGAGQDIESATDIARKMVCEWGMSAKLGPLAYGNNDSQPFLGKEMRNVNRNFSEQTAIEIDQEVRLLVTTQYDLAKNLLEDNLDLLKLVAESLLEFEVLDGADLDMIIDNGSQDVLRTSKEKQASASAARGRAPRDNFVTRSRTRRPDGSSDPLPPKLNPASGEG
jgi:cell division protease FtsH